MDYSFLTLFYSCILEILIPIILLLLCNILLIFFSYYLIFHHAYYSQSKYTMYQIELLPAATYGILALINTHYIITHD